MIGFVCPDPASFVSGGNRYNERLMRALQLSGHTVQRISLEEYIPVGMPGATLLLFDSLYFAKLKKEALGDTGIPKGLIVHYLPGLEAAARGEKVDWGWLSGKFEFAVVPSRFVGELLVRHGAWPASSIWEVPPILQVEKTMLTPDLPPQLLIVGNYLPVKGLLPFLETFERILAEKTEPIPSFQLTVAGTDDLDTEYTARCRTLVQQSGILKNRVQLLPAISSEELLDYYRRAALLLSPSSFETFGMAVAEALILGLPVLGLRRGNLSNLVNEPSNGLLFSDLEAMIKVILQLLTHPEHMLDLRERARSHPLENRFTAERAVEGLKKIIE